VVDAVGVADDQAAALLAEDRLQPCDRDCAAADDVAQDVTRSHAGELIRVADQQQVRVRGDGLEQVVKQRQVDHGRLIHDDHVGVERVLVVVGKALRRAVAQQAVDGLGGLAGRLRKALGRAAGRAAQQVAVAGLLQGGDDRLHGEGFARAGATGHDADLAGERLADGGALLLGQRQRRPGPQRRQERPPVHRAQVGQAAVRRVQHLPQPPGDAHLGVVKRRQVDGLLLPAGGIRHGVDRDLVGGVQAIDGRLDAVRCPLQPQQLARQPDQLRARQEDVPVVGGFVEGVDHAGGHAVRRVLRQAQVAGNFVGSQEADAPDIAGQAVGVFLHLVDGLVAVGLVDLDRQAGGDTMALQEEHDLLDRLLFRPGAGDHLHPLLADVRHFQQALRVVIEHVQRLQAEVVDDLLGGARPDAPDQPAAQVAAHRLDGGGHGLAHAFRPELVAVAGVLHPLAIEFHRLAGL